MRGCLHHKNATIIYNGPYVSISQRQCKKTLFVIIHAEAARCGVLIAKRVEAEGPSAESACVKTLTNSWYCLKRYLFSSRYFNFPFLARFVVVRLAADSMTLFPSLNGLGLCVASLMGRCDGV